MLKIYRSTIFEIYPISNFKYGPWNWTLLKLMHKVSNWIALDNDSIIDTVTNSIFELL